MEALLVDIAHVPTQVANGTKFRISELQLWQRIRGADRPKSENALVAFFYRRTWVLSNPPDQLCAVDDKRNRRIVTKCLLQDTKTPSGLDQVCFRTIDFVVSHFKAGMLIFDNL